MAERNQAFNLALKPSENRASLNSPTSMPNACGFLWNKELLLQMNCRGYAIAQFMQPEPSKYSQGPMLEAKTFIQPEHPYFAHHPGRFFYIKDEQTGDICSVPHEPCRKTAEKFNFSVGTKDISWTITTFGLLVELSVTLPLLGAAEIWSIKVSNHSNKERKLSIYPYFTIGYKSWMNQSAEFDDSANAIVAKSITPYQKVEDYEKNKSLKDCTFLLSKHRPTAWTTVSSTFEGEGGLVKPDQIADLVLSCEKAAYELPVAVMQFRETLMPQQSSVQQFVFGAALDIAEVKSLKYTYFGKDHHVASLKKQYSDYIDTSFNTLNLQCNDKALTDFVNTWLPRQVFYHGDANRLTTDPQTRNYLQDNMGLSFIEPTKTRQAFLTALKQQNPNGAMPDGILLHPDATLKYINQVPHADHGVWLTICLQAYLNETNDIDILSHQTYFSNSVELGSVITHVERCLEYLLSARDHRGLSYIEQGDWCDPMNMVGHKGKGVSSWLSLATAYAINCWCDIVEHYIEDYSASKLSYFRAMSDEINDAVNEHLWDGSWYARGITDDNKVFGVKNDVEGRIYLNPQSWALLSGAAGVAKKFSMLNEIEQQLNTPFGTMMLAPSYTKMREDVGRLTQKHPGVAENGSIYNHAGAFYIYSLYQIGEYNQAFQLLRKMIPTELDMEKKGQLPVYIPNYYRGAYYQLPEHAGRSSHLFNTGTVAWFYRCVIEELCGLKGLKGDLVINPKLPDSLDKISGTRLFQQAFFEFTIVKYDVKHIEVRLNGELLPNNIISDIRVNGRYILDIRVPQ